MRRHYLGVGEAQVRTPEAVQTVFNLFRSQLWGKAMGVNLAHFADDAKVGTKSVLLEKSLPSAVCYAIE